MQSAYARPAVRKGDLAYLLDSAGATPPEVVRVDLVTAVYVYWRMEEPRRADHHRGQHGRTFKHLNLVVPRMHVPEARPRSEASAPAPAPTRVG